MTHQAVAARQTPSLDIRATPSCLQLRRTLPPMGCCHAFLRAYAAAEPMEILSPEAALVVRLETRAALPAIDDAPGVVPELPTQKSIGRRARQKQKSVAS